MLNLQSNEGLKVKPNESQFLYGPAANTFGVLIGLVFIIDFGVLMSFYPNIDRVTLTHAVIQCGIGCMFLLLNYLTKVKYSALGVLMIYLFLTLVVFYYSSVLKMQTGISMYYFPLLISLLAIFDSKHHKRHRFAVVAVVILLFFTGNTFDLRQPFDSELNKYYAKRTRMVAYVQSFMLVSASIYLAFKKNEGLSELYYEVTEQENWIKKLKEQEAIELNSSWNDLLELAKHSDVELIVLFKMLYPDFLPNLLKVDPNLSHELFRLCIYIKLGFSTKEIAEYNFRTFRSIQTKKNRLRKSFKLSPSIDLYEWIKCC